MQHKLFGIYMSMILSCLLTSSNGANGAERATDKYQKSLALTLKVVQNPVLTNTPVTFEISVRNVGDNEVTLDVPDKDFPGEITIYDDGGRDVRGESIKPTPKRGRSKLKSLTLKANEEKTYKMQKEPAVLVDRVGGSLPAGTYSAKATFPIVGYKEKKYSVELISSSRAEFKVVERVP